MNKWVVVISGLAVLLQVVLVAVDPGERPLALLGMGFGFWLIILWCHFDGRERE